MTRRNRLLSFVTLVGAFMVWTGAFASQEAPKQVTMDSQVYGAHKKGLVTWSHEKHSGEFKIACAECHHVYQDGKNVWKEGDAVQKCEACHAEAKAPAGQDAPSLSKEEKIKKYHYVAIHENCVGCHKAEKKSGKEGAPAACKDCHLEK